MTSVVQLLRHIYLGFAHVLAFLFLPTHKSFQTIHELTEAGYQVSYLDHCRIQHNMRFATLSYSLVLASIITFVTTTVEIIFPDRLATPVFAATLTVNSNGDDNDGSCDVAPGDCTLREAINQANSLAGTDNITVSLSDGSVVTLTDALPAITETVTIDGGGALNIDCNNNFWVGLEVQSANTELKNLTVQNCTDTGIAIKAGANSFVVSDSVLDSNEFAVIVSANDGIISDNTINGSSNQGIMIIDAGSNAISGNTISVSGVSPAIDLGNADSTVITNNTITADDFMELVNTDDNIISGNTMMDDDPNTNGTNIHLQFSSSNTFDDNTITVSDATVFMIEYSSHSNVISNNTIDGQNLAAAGFEITDSNLNTLTGNTLPNFPGNAVELRGSATGNIIGLDADFVGTANTFLGNTTDVQISDSVSAALIRGNTTDNSDVTAMIDYASDPIDPPTLTTHTTTTLAGTATANAEVDIYLLSPTTGYVTYVDTATAEADGKWDFTSDTLAGATALYLTATTATAGTSAFMTEAHPQADVDIILSNITATVLSASEVSISWDTNIASNSRVRYGTSADALSSKVENDDSVIEHQLKLTDLQGDTTYYYQARSELKDDSTAVTSNTQSFTMEADENLTLADYAETVAQTIEVDHLGSDNTAVVGNGSTTTTLPFGNLTFIFNDLDGGLNNYRLHFVLREAKKNAQAIVDKKKAFDAAREARFKVKQQQLEKEKTYAVLSGVIKQDGGYLNTTGLAKRFTFTLQDIPQLIYPSNTEIFYRMPEEFIVASKAPSVTVYIDDVTGAEVVHCTAVMENGLGSCSMPFHVPGLGEYTIRLVDSRGGVISESILFSDIANIITTDVRSVNFYKRIIFGGNPTFAGLVGTGNTIELHIPQINGPMYAQVTGNSWVFTLTLTALSYGATEFIVIERNPVGDIVSQNNYLVYRSYRPVVPAIIAPENNSAATTAPTIQVIGPNDHTLEIFNSENVRLFLGDFVNGGRVIDLSSWFSNTDTYTITLQNRNSLNIPSASTTFTFTITAPVTVVEDTISDTTTETDNTNTSNNTNSNSSNTNTSTNTNTDQSNTNSSNTNTTDTTNTNTNSSTTDQTQPDTDGDGVSDAQEIEDRTDPTDKNSKKIVDTDKDGLADIEEPDYGTDPNDPDTDDDTMFDGDEVTFGSDPLSADGDADGLTDPQEYALQTDPRQSDTDSDDVLDGAEVSNQTIPTDPDSDDDDLPDNESTVYGTDALDADSDNDGLLDGEEIDRSCDPLNMDSDGDKIDDLVEALAGTDCSSIDNLWSNLSSIEAYLQEQANTVGVNYPLITHQIVPAEADLDQKLTQQITTATTLDIIPGAKTVVSDGTIRVITQTTEISVVDWLTGQNPATTDNTYVLVSGTVSLPDSVRGQPAYVLVTFFSTPMVKIAQVDGNGQWTMTVPAELLTAGEHTALAALEVNGTRSEQVEVAKFVINHKRKLSSTSWLVIVNVVVAILALLIAVIVHLRRKRSDESYA